MSNYGFFVQFFRIKFIFDVLCVNERQIKKIMIYFVVEIMVFESKLNVIIQLEMFFDKIILKLGFGCISIIDG